MSALAYTRAGDGPPLLLVHGVGLTRGSWEPVLPELTTSFDVIAVDLPGFGETPALPPGVVSSPAAMAARVMELLDEIGVERPHVVGNSVGGWVALELAQARPVSSVTLLSPAGLWRSRTPFYCRVSLRTTRVLARLAPRLLGWSVRNRLARHLVFRQTHGRPRAMSPESARATILGMGTCPGFPPVMRATAGVRYTALRPIDAPVTVAFGDKDLLLLRGQSRHLDQLPAHTVVAELPGCGHVPMGDDPAAVTALIRACSGERRVELGA